MLRACSTAVNSSRGNNVYSDITTRQTTNGSYDPGTAESSSQLKYRGIAARIIFYTATKWWHHPGKNSKNLELVDYDSYTSGENVMGELTFLLKWNLEYPVDESEIYRNEYLANYLGTRNPFIDHPEYACRIWGNTDAKTKTACSLA